MIARLTIFYEMNLFDEVFNGDFFFFCLWFCRWSSHRVDDALQRLEAVVHREDVVFAVSYG